MVISHSGLERNLLVFHFQLLKKILIIFLSLVFLYYWTMVFAKFQQYWIFLDICDFYPVHCTQSCKKITCIVLRFMTWAVGWHPNKGCVYTNSFKFHTEGIVMQCVMSCQMMEIIYISLSEVALEILSCRVCPLSVLAVSRWKPWKLQGRSWTWDLSNMIRAVNVRMDKAVEPLGIWR